MLSILLSGPSVHRGLALVLLSDKRFPENLSNTLECIRIRRVRDGLRGTDQHLTMGAI